MRHKRIFILIIAIIFIVGCAPADKEKIIVTVKNEPIYIRIYTNHCTENSYITDDLANEIYASDYYSDWRQVLLDEYNLDIKLHMISSSDFISKGIGKHLDYMKEYDIVANTYEDIFSNNFKQFMEYKAIPDFCS